MEVLKSHMMMSQDDSNRKDGLYEHMDTKKKLITDDESRTEQEGGTS